MAGTAGSVAPVFRAEGYVATNIYDFYHAIIHNNKLYFCRQDGTVGHEPTGVTDEYWFLSLDGNFGDAKKLGGETAAQWQTKIDVEKARIDALIALEESGELTDIEKEVNDIKVGADGVTYGTAGTAVRTQIANVNTKMDTEISELKSDLSVSYSELKGTIADFTETFVTNPVNWLDENNLSSGEFVGTNGELASNAYYASTDFIPVEVGDTIRLQFDFKGTRYDLAEKPGYATIYFSALYDENKVFIANSYSTSCSYRSVDTEGAKYIRLTLSTDMFDGSAGFDNIAIVKGDTSTVLPYSEYFEPYTTTLVNAENDGEGNNIADTYMKKSDVFAFLPSEICVAVGRTIELYNSQVCVNADKYHFKWDCAVGSALERKFTITGTEPLIGNYTLSLSLYDDEMKEVWTGETTIKIVNAYTETMTFLAIGDSLTNGKAWLSEIQNLCETITTVGTRGGGKEKDADGEWRVVFHEGRSGWSAENYLMETSYTYENEGIHPFWDDTNQRFNWSYYVTNSLGSVSPDAIVIWLGTNGKGNSLDAEPNVADIKQIVDYIRQDDSTIKIYMMLPMYKGTQDGIGYQKNVDGYATDKGKWKYEEDMKVYNLLVCLYDALKDYTNLYFLPATQCHDSEYNYQTITMPVNPRASQTEIRQTESVHPLDQGYYQIADILFSSISAHQGN